MSRAARIVVPGYPHHVVHRGHNRQQIFLGPPDYEAYLENLGEFRAQFRVRVHAYCLMPNHVHLLLDPAQEEGLARLMKHVAGRHAARWNRRAGRCGAVWQGRYYSSLVDREAYHLVCGRYIERNPVRAGIAADPAAYPWSSCRWRAAGSPAPWLDLDPLYLDLGDTPAARWDRWSAFLDAGTPARELQLLRDAVNREQLTGDEAFARRMAPLLGRLVLPRGRGRPRRAPAEK
jgi:putative transposase